MHGKIQGSYAEHVPEQVASVARMAGAAQDTRAAVLIRNPGVRAVLRDFERQKTEVF